MAEAMLSRALASEICSAADIYVTELLDTRINYLNHQYGIMLVIKELPLRRTKV